MEHGLAVLRGVLVARGVHLQMLHRVCRGQRWWRGLVRRLHVAQGGMVRIGGVHRGVVGRVGVRRLLTVHR